MKPETRSTSGVVDARKISELEVIVIDAPAFKAPPADDVNETCSFSGFADFKVVLTRALFQIIPLDVVYPATGFAMNAVSREVFMLKVIEDPRFAFL